MKIIIYILLSINALGLDLQLITKIPLENFNNEENIYRFSISHIRKDWCFLVNYDGKKTAVITDTGKYIIFDSPHESTVISTNIVSIVKNLNGENTYTIDEVSRNSITKNNGILILKTMSSSGYISESLSYGYDDTTRFTVNNQGTNKIYLGSANFNFSTFTKFNSQWKPVSSLQTYGNTSNQISDPRVENTIDANSKQTITYELKDGFIYFYRLTDSDLLSSPNRIILGSSQNGPLTATVNNPEQALLNIQSSTNLIDWNTFKTIKNEPSLEIVVPANKKQEFLRAIE